jgi:hypothetical protein
MDSIFREQLELWPFRPYGEKAWAKKALLEGGASGRAFLLRVRSDSVDGGDESGERWSSCKGYWPVRVWMSLQRGIGGC